MTEKTERLWRDFHRRLGAFIARRVANKADAEDILQDVFLRVHRRVATLEKAGSLVPWLFQVARNAIVDHYRKPSRRREAPLAEGPAPVEKNADDGRARRELSACLRPMIQSLPRDYRTALTLVEMEGVSQKEASKRLGISFSGMKSRVQRGREKLKHLLHDCCHIRLGAAGDVADYDVRNPARCPCAPSKRA